MWTDGDATTVARRLVEQLFDRESPSRFDDLLLAGVGLQPLFRAIDWYINEAETTGLHSAPAITVIAASGSPLPTDRFDEIRELDDETFLGDGPALSSEFDYLLAVPPTLDRGTLSRNRRADYAARYASLTTADEELSTAALYIEESMEYLRSDGIGVVLTGSGLWEETGPGELHAAVYDHIQAVAELPTGERVASVLRGAANATLGAPPARPDPSRVESRLNRSFPSEGLSFTAAAIASSPVATYAGDMPAASAYTRLLSDDYDAVLVDLPETETAHYYARVEDRPRAEERLEDRARPVDAERLVAPGTSLQRVIAELGRMRFQFVGEPTAVSGILTRFDLNKLPVYLYLFDRFSEFEISLRRFIRRNAPDWDARTDVFIPSRGNRDLVPDRLANAQLGELLEIIEALALSERTDEWPRSTADARLDDLRQLRNDVAHYQPLVHTMGESTDGSERDATELAAQLQLLLAINTRIAPAGNDSHP